MTSTDGAHKPAPKDPWDLPDVSGLVVGVLGGTGDQGRGLAYRVGPGGRSGRR
jgi:8-hydroxy-5-deazaflavin:NADPH oxidoreductase